MKTKARLIVLLVVAFSLFVATAVAAAKTELSTLEIINKSDQTATLILVGDLATYVLNVPGGETRLFTVERDIYDRTTLACGESDTGTIDLETRVRLVFTSCYSDAPNMGEPSIEKVHIPDSPDGINWYYR